MKKTILPILLLTLLLTSCYKVELDKEQKVELAFNKVSLSKVEKEFIINRLKKLNKIDHSLYIEDITLERVEISGAEISKEELNYAVEQNYDLNSKKVNMQNASCGIECWCDRDWIDIGDTGCVISFCQCMNSSCNLRITEYIYCHSLN